MISIAETLKNRALIKDVRNHLPIYGLYRNSWEEDPNWRIHLQDFVSEDQGVDLASRTGDDDLVLTHTAGALRQVNADKRTQRDIMRVAYLTAAQSREERATDLSSHMTAEEGDYHRKMRESYLKRVRILKLQLRLLGLPKKDSGEIQAMIPGGNVVLFRRPGKRS